MCWREGVPISSHLETDDYTDKLGMPEDKLLAETAPLCLGFTLKKRPRSTVIQRITITAPGRTGVIWREHRDKNADVRRPEMCQADPLEAGNLEKGLLILRHIRKAVPI